MPTKNNKFYSLILVLVDILVLFAAFTLAYVIRVQYDNRPLVNPILSADYIQAFLVIVPIWVLIFATLGLYNASTYNRRLVEWGKIALGTFLGILVVIGWEYVAERYVFPARLVAVYSLFGAFFLLVFGREVLRFGRRVMFQFGRGINRVLIIGNSDATRDIADSLSFTARSGYKIVAIAGPVRTVPPGLDVVHFTSVESALKRVNDLRITTIIQTDLYDSAERNQRILGAAQVNHIAYNFIPGEPEFYTGKKHRRCVSWLPYDFCQPNTTRWLGCYRQNDFRCDSVARPSYTFVTHLSGTHYYAKAIQPGACFLCQQAT